MRPPSFGADITNQANNEPQLPAVMHCTRMAGRAIIRVVGRCNDAQENNNLDLSECQLIQVPDAVYHLMRNTALRGCNLSSNVITKIPPKFAVKFSLITDLNLSHNQMSKLPDELVDLAERNDWISHTMPYISLPNVVFKIPKLTHLNARHNHIVDVEVERLRVAPSLQEVDLQENPLSPRCHNELSAVTSVQVRLSVREREDWEDLTV
ncbi:Leucine-rich repeat protein soc-2 homolog [Gryllus bimaculatus]|nr:Leucine-rich repeat protein soc-2 homolog [Gryllus bimaculatus]